MLVLDLVFDETATEEQLVARAPAKPARSGLAAAAQTAALRRKSRRGRALGLMDFIYSLLL
jgi:hypothetical protein